METKFKETPIGKIPEDWEVVRLGDVADFYRGYSYRSSDLSTRPTKLRFITINDFEKEGGIKTNAEHLYLREDIQIDEKFCLRENDILIANTDMSKGFIIGAPLRISKTLTESANKLIYSMDLTKLVLKTEKVSPEFLFYFLSWGKIRRIMKTYAQGTNVLHLNHNLAKTLNVTLPPLPEQKKIAEILSTVDKAIEKVNEAIARTERLKKGLMQELLTKGIGHTEFKDTEIGRIPKEWEVVRLEEVVVSYKNGIYKPRKYYGRGYPCIRMYNIVNGYINKIDAPLLEVTKQELEEYGLKEGDIVINRVNTPELVGKAGLVPPNFGKATFESKNIRIRLNTTRMLPNFFTIFAQTEKYFRQIRSFAKTAVAQATITQKDLDNLKIPLPLLHEQQKIAEILSTVDKKLELERKRKDKLERIKRGLMNDLLTGRRRVKV